MAFPSRPILRRVPRPGALAAAGLVVAAMTAVAHQASASVISIDPRATFLRTNDDAALAAAPIELASLPFAVNPGDYLLLARVGDFDFGPGDDDGRNLIALFSSSATLFAGGLLDRVPGAIDVGVDFVSQPTRRGDLPTDIPADFFVPGAGQSPASLIVKVPVGAAYLFVAAADTLYEDNSDPNGDYGISITTTSSVNPEPTALVTWAGLALAAAVVARKSGSRLAARADR